VLAHLSTCEIHQLLSPASNKIQILLVPTTIFLLTHRDRETHVIYSDLVNSDDFLASHIIRIPANLASATPQKHANGDPPTNLRESLRESRTKAKQYSTLNGRTVILKDAYVYGNKGFRTLNQVQLLTDALYFPDSPDSQPWIIYYISKPLVGTPEGIRYLSVSAIEARPTPRTQSESWKLPSPTEKKSVTSFSHLMDQFPIIAKQMVPGLERILNEFKREVEKPLPALPPSSVTPRSNHKRQGSASSSRSNSVRSRSGSVRSESDTNIPIYHSSLELKTLEEDLQHSLETAITSAIDLFQMVDKQQLSLLGSTTDLTGATVEKMIEKYLTEQCHDVILFPRICSLRKTEDVDLESRIRQMTDIDISQVGISMDMSRHSKKELSLRLAKGVDHFKRMSVAGSPQEMLEILLETQKIITRPETGDQGSQTDPEKSQAIMTISADTLVSLLLIVVIRSPVRHLQARLSYMRHFIFIDDTETGELGYALSTFEAVLSYLAHDSAGLRRSSMRNRKFWQATKTGNVPEMKQILEPSEDAIDRPDEPLEIPVGVVIDIPDEPDHNTADAELDTSNGSLDHVFPFERPQTPGERRSRAKKRVLVQSRSNSVSSAYSLHSLALTIGSQVGDFEGDLSIATLVQTQGTSGDSVLMMTVQNQQARALKYLLNMKEYFTAQFILEDEDDEGTTLLSAALQTGNHEITQMLLDFIIDSLEQDEILAEYLARTDSNGRCVGHYLFYFPALIERVGDRIPWTLKDKNGQTPLFALCRSYDNEEYHDMVENGLLAATKAQKDSQPLRLEEHIDHKGNTLLHIVNDAELANVLLTNCDSDVNASNDKHFTPLMVASKYGRSDMVRALFRDLRVDLYSRDLRGLTATELAKDDEVRNRIDDLVLLSSPSGQTSIQDRITGVIRSFFVEDGTVRFIIKSGVQDSIGLITITTCRRLLSDFDDLAKWLALEHPASWIPNPRGFPSPFMLPTRPSRAISRDMQLRLDSFLNILLTHSTFGTHEMVWEFFLVPEIEPSVHAERSKRKAELRMETVRDEFEPILNVREVETFILFAKESVRNVHEATKAVMGKSNGVRNAQVDLHDATILCRTAFSLFLPLPIPYARALGAYARALAQPEFSPIIEFFYAFSAISTTSGALLSALSRPSDLVSRINATHKIVDKAANSLRRASDRSGWPRPLGINLLDEARTKSQKDAAAKMDTAIEEQLALGRELRYTQQVVAGELASWQDQRAKMGRDACKALAMRMVVAEKERLASLKRVGRIIGLEFSDEQRKKPKLPKRPSGKVTNGNGVV
jgi:hypothetical protein